MGTERIRQKNVMLSSRSIFSPQNDLSYPDKMLRKLSMTFFLHQRPPALVGWRGAAGAAGTVFVEGVG